MDTYTVVLGSFWGLFGTINFLSSHGAISACWDFWSLVFHCINLDISFQDKMKTSIREVPWDLAMSALLIMVNYFREIDKALENLGAEWDNLLRSWGCNVVNLFPREVPRVLNLFHRKLIEGTQKDFPKVNRRPHQRPDPRLKTWGATGPEGFWPKMRQRVCLRKILSRAFDQLPREQIENSRDFPREQIHHATPKAFQQIVILTKSLQCLPEENPEGGLQSTP